MPRDVTTRWNSTYNMLIFAIEYHKALDIITSECDMKLRSYKLSQEEWDIAAHLSWRCVVFSNPLVTSQLWTNPFPQIFKDATLFFSRGTPNIATVIPAMDHIDSKLATDARNNKNPLSIKAALAVGKKTLNRYYDKTNHSEIFRIAMGMFLSSSVLSLSTSAPPSPQTAIFLRCWLGGRLDQDGKRYRTGRIWAEISLFQGRRDNDFSKGISLWLNLSQLQRISSTTFLHSQHQKNWAFETTWIDIWALTLKMSVILFCGGTNIGMLILASIVWLWITCQSLVCFFH